jgi:PAS domain S-box-containing protein
MVAGAAIYHLLFWRAANTNSLLAAVFTLLVAGGIAALLGNRIRSGSRFAGLRFEEQAPLAEAIRSTIDQIRVTTAYIDEERCFRSVNAALARWMGRLPSDISEVTVDDVFERFLNVDLRAEFDAALAGTPAKFERAIVHPVHGLIDLEIELIPNWTKEQSVRGFHLCMQDVTERNRALEAAKYAERRMQLIMDQIPVTVTYIDADFKYRYINRAQELWLGKTAAEVIGREVREVTGETVWTDIAPSLKAALAGETRQIERERTDRNGKRVWHSGRYVPDVNDEGVVVGLYSVFFDITQRARGARIAGTRDRVADRKGSCDCREPGEIAISRQHEP